MQTWKIRSCYLQKQDIIQTVHPETCPLGQLFLIFLPRISAWNELAKQSFSKCLSKALKIFLLWPCKLHLISSGITHWDKSGPKTASPFLSLFRAKEKAKGLYCPKPSTHCGLYLALRQHLLRINKDMGQPGRPCSLTSSILNTNTGKTE